MFHILSRHKQMPHEEKQKECRVKANRAGSWSAGISWMNHKFSGRKTFTLIELLITIGIIAILASILLPALQKARDKGNKIKCAANLKQMGTGLIMYVDDYDGYLFHNSPVVGTEWNDLLAPYLSRGTGTVQFGQIYVCPANKYRYGGSEDLNYVYNNYFVYRKYNTTPYPSEKMIFADGWLKESYWYYVFNQNSTYDAEHYWTIWMIHSFQANACWLDGHVNSVTSNEIQANWIRWVRYWSL
ncbi:MAG: type II secretion system protein [Victivallaceae bacterium]|nr:type II secretion system protein [Victivallaceae bacterium]